MSTWDRSGTGLFALKIGEWRNLRNELMHPGERWQPVVTGRADLAPLREPYLTPIHVTMLMAWTPLRWLWTGLTQAIKDGRKSTATVSRYLRPGTVPVLIGGDGGSLNYDRWGDLVSRIQPDWEERHKMLMYNAHLKWPQDDEVSAYSQVPAPIKAVRLESLWSRTMGGSLSKENYTVITESVGNGPFASRERVDIRKLAAMQGRLRSVQKRDWMADDRYVDVLKEVWDSSGSREVDKWPLILDDKRGWMAGGDMMASDGDNLGARAGTMTFGINHRMPYSFTAPEHGLFSYWMCLRVQPMHVRQVNPIMSCRNDNLGELLADPDYLSNQMERILRNDEAFGGQGRDGSDNLGRVPTGQKWRTGWNQIDGPLAKRGSFLIDKGPISETALRYEGNYDHAFRSVALGHCLTRVDFHQISDSKVPDPMASLMAGA